MFIPRDAPDTDLAIFFAKKICNVLMKNNKLSWSHLIDLPDIRLFEVSGPISGHQIRYPAG
jgi:hypothetical protein